jgi:hypothetical protein
VAVIILDRPFDLSPVQVWSSEGPERCDEVAIPGFGLQRRVPLPLQSSDGRLRVFPNASNYASYSTKRRLTTIFSASMCFASEVKVPRKCVRPIQELPSLLDFPIKHGRL